MPRVAVGPQGGERGGLGAHDVVVAGPPRQLEQGTTQLVQLREVAAGDRGTDPVGGAPGGQRPPGRPGPQGRKLGEGRRRGRAPTRRRDIGMHDLDKHPVRVTGAPRSSTGAGAIEVVEARGRVDQRDRLIEGHRRPFRAGRLPPPGA
jgi:hypothetical protein